MPDTWRSYAMTEQPARRSGEDLLYDFKGGSLRSPPATPPRAAGARKLASSSARAALARSSASQIAARFVRLRDRGLELRRHSYGASPSDDSGGLRGVRPDRLGGGSLVAATWILTSLRRIAAALRCKPVRIWSGATRPMQPRLPVRQNRGRGDSDGGSCVDARQLGGVARLHLAHRTACR